MTADDPLNSQDATRFHLMRHAQTVWNFEKRIQGQENAPLTEKGAAQARQWGKALQEHGFHRILASDLGRARETVEQVNFSLGLPVQFDPHLREQDWGRWTGKTLKQIEEEQPEVLQEQMSRGWKFCPPGGETRLQVLKRSYVALKEAGRQWPGENILVVCHGGVIKCLVYHFSRRRFLPTEPTIIQPAHLHELQFNRSGLQLRAVNAFSLKL